jgi:RHH-type proline utilization regulon transcriptional repressor/proline dehydrogenase/delta 1-pyrroline-5-carboxylate dehydrogenase
MLFGAMDALVIGDPWHLSTDVGPVIDGKARDDILAYIEERQAQIIKQLAVPSSDNKIGTFVPPTVLSVNGMADLKKEVFGPVLHVATFDVDKIDQVIDEVNAAGYGLTFGLHTRVDQRVQQVIDHVAVGNFYVNRNQIGAVVGSQPFGGEGLSGTGPKAGGPLYLSRFCRTETEAIATPSIGGAEASIEVVEQAFQQIDASEWCCYSIQERLECLNKADLSIDEAITKKLSVESLNLPGPTGESNRLEFHPRGRVLCLGAIGCEDTSSLALKQAVMALLAGNEVVIVTPKSKELEEVYDFTALPIRVISALCSPAVLEQVDDLASVAVCGNTERLRELRKALANRDGALVPIVTDLSDPMRFVLERSVCIDTTAAGGNASLLASVAQ